MFDPASQVPWSHLGRADLETPEHTAQALRMARESMVLLKNDRHLLPLSSKVRKIALVGPNADNPVTQLGNYNGVPTRDITLLDALRQEKGIEVVCDALSDFVRLNDGVTSKTVRLTGTPRYFMY